MMTVSCKTVPSCEIDAGPDDSSRRWAVPAAGEAVSLGAPLPEDFPNALRAAEPWRPRLSARRTWLGGLLLLCLIPRLLMIPRLSSICPDGVLYIRLALALEEGHFQEGFQEMNLNLHPLALMVLHRLGLDWADAGFLWGTATSTLVVLPLFGWIRRQFDDPTAVLACVLYAVHPVFIQWSPEIIRDPAFWFFFTLTLYLSWRAVTEVRWRWFFAAGFSLTLALLTRFEGFLLLIPLVLWAFWRRRALVPPAARRRLLGGTLITLLAFPLLILGVNLIWMQRHENWIFSRLAPLAMVRYWWQGMIAPLTPLPGASPELQTGVPLFKMIRIFVPNMVKGLSPLFALLLLGGIIRWRRVWFRRDHQPLFIAAMVMFLATWIHAWCAQESCVRYFLPVVLMGAPFAALSLRALILWFPRCLGRFVWHPLAYRLAGMLPVLAIGLIGWAAAFTGPYARRAAEVELAHWIRHQFGPHAILFGSEGVTPVVGYYAELPWTVLKREMDDDTVLEHVRRLKPDVILVMHTRRKDPQATPQLIKRIEALGFHALDSSRLPEGTEQSLTVVIQESAYAALVSHTEKNPSANQIP
jgi:hypothetical protein